jgi:hypothetical protein
MYSNGLLLNALKLIKFLKNVHYRGNRQLPWLNVLLNVLQRRSEAFKLLKLFILKTIKIKLIKNC